MQENIDGLDLRGCLNEFSNSVVDFCALIKINLGTT